MGRILLLLALLVPAAAAAELRFERVDRSWGIDFHHHHGGSGRYYMVETDGGGVVIFDYDGDGDQDVFLIDGGALPGYRGPEPRSRLFRNDGDRRFVDVTAAAGISHRVYGSGAAAGVDDPLWGSAAAFADVDRDGDLDLYVVNYVDFDVDRNIPCGDAGRNLRGYCGPDVYSPQPDRFYRNAGSVGGTVRFEEAAAAAGLTAGPGAGLALSFGDLDGDGWVDLYVANDLTPNFLYKNRGDGPSFADRGLLSGTAYGPRGLAEAGMGVAIGDYDGDGRFDIAVTNYEGETNALYRNRGSLLFADRRFVSGLAEPTLRRLAFGVAAGDFDHDGDLDLAFANGHVRDNAAEFNRSSRYRQPNQVFANLGDGRFREVTAAGLDFAAASRGLAAGDLDGDGDLDLVISNVDAGAEVYANLSPPPTAGWLQVDLRGRHNRFGIGARIDVEAGGRLQVREVRCGESYMSQHALTAHFGLGNARRVERLTVRWPDGAKRVLRGLPAGRRIVWTQ